MQQSSKPPVLPLALPVWIIGSYHIVGRRVGGAATPAGPSGGAR